MAGVYHPERLNVKSRCAVAVGTVGKVKFEAYDGDVHLDLRLDPGYEPVSYTHLTLPTILRV